jgi:hypothetical protein
MNKGDILGYYYGIFIREEAWDDTNEYNLKLEHMDAEGGAFIDGTPADPIDEYRLSLINGDYTETMTMHNCIIDKYGRIIMTRKTGKGKQLLMHYGLDEKGQTCYNWDKLDDTLVKIAITKTMELTSIISKSELLQLKEAEMSKNHIYDKIKKMVIEYVKPKVRHNKPTNQNVEESIDYLYSLGIYRDWVMKQKTEEGILRQNVITARDIENEVRMVKGIRYSKSLQNMDEDINTEKAETKSPDCIVVETTDKEPSFDKEILLTIQLMPKCVQKFLLGVLNINTLTNEKLVLIMQIYVKEEYDIIALVDTRATKKDENTFNAIIRKYQRKGDYHKYFDIKENLEGFCSPPTRLRAVT